MKKILLAIVLILFFGYLHAENETSTTNTTVAVKVEPVPQFVITLEMLQSHKKVLEEHLKTASAAEIIKINKKLDEINAQIEKLTNGKVD